MLHLLQTNKYPIHFESQNQFLLHQPFRQQLSRHQQLRDYELGHVKEGVGAGGLALLAQLRGIGTDQLLADCDRAMDALLQQPRGCTGGGSLGSEP